MATKLTRLQGSVEIFGPERCEEAGVSWDPRIHIAIGLWQVGRGRSSWFGLVAQSAPDVGRIAAIAELAVRSQLEDQRSVHALCGSYWDLSHVRPTLDDTGIVIAAEIEERLGGTRWALEINRPLSLAKVIQHLWGECHSFVAYTAPSTARDRHVLLENLDTNRFRLRVAQEERVVLIRHSHAEDLVLVVERERCTPDFIAGLRHVVEDAT